ncbi:MAG: hypothetical protein FJX75_00475 [Armatimonadetes bacterium]|nr:hypothetical protein [Armatimonadota bacterium]
MRMRYGHLVIGFGVVVLASALIAGVAWGVDDPAGVMRLYVEVPDWVIDPTDTQNGPASRFGLQTLTGDPTTLNDDNAIVASVVDPTNNLNTYSSITTISIDNSDAQATDTVMADLSTIQDGGGREFWPLPPTERTRDVVYRMLVGIDDNDPSQAVEVIEVYAQLVLLRDTLKLDFVLTNRGTQTHRVGLRHFIDCQFGGGLQQNDGTFITLSDGRIIDTETVLGVTESVPDAWVSFDSTSNPAVILRGTITGGEVDDPGLATYSAGAPDRVEFGQRINMGNDDQFDFTPTSTFTIAGEDWGAATRWDEETLSVGASRRYVTYYGLGGSASDFTPPYVLASYAPFELQVIEDDDPTTPDVEDAYLADSSGSAIWDVLAYCDNFGAGSILDARATISLPPGLELDQTQGMQSRTVLLGSITRNAQASAVWHVRAVPGVRPGVHTITVSGPLGRSVTRKINIPALPTLPQDGLDPVRGLSMVTVPYIFQMTDAEHVFQSLGSLQGSDAALVRWDPRSQIYRFFPDNFVTNIEPGAAYWLLNRLRLPITFPDPPDRQPVPTTDPFALNLDMGWNQIGCPFTTTVRFDQVKIVGSDGIERSVLDAASAGLIVPTLFAYDPAQNDYTFHTVLGNMVMEPYVGYWLLVLRPITFVFPAPTIMPFKAQPTSPAPTAPDGWRVPLVVKGGDLERTNRALGTADGAADGPDLADVMCPPSAAAPNGARLDAYFLCDGWGPRSGRYYTDVRSARPGKQSWSFVVDTDMSDQPISISWPDLSQMPQNLIATLEDLQSGRVRFMRTSTSYTFGSSQGGPRQFRVTVEDRGAAALQIMGFNCAPTAQGVQMSYTLSAPASVDVVVRNIAGRVVKRVVQSRQTPAGEAVVTWSGQQDNGLLAPNGAYVIQVVARSPEGEQTGLLRTVYYHR